MDEGAYLVLTVLGPSSARNVPRYITSTLLNPLSYMQIDLEHMFELADLIQGPNVPGWERVFDIELEH